jgi:hypothetical protein
VRALGECDRPPITTWLGSGICGEHLLGAAAARHPMTTGGSKRGP